MNPLSSFFSTVGGRRILLGLGGLYVVSALIYPFIPASSEVALGIELVLGFLVGVPGLLLLFAGYRLPQSDIRPEFYVTIISWCVAGIGVILAILGLIEIVTDLRDAVQNILILTALGSAAGLGIGQYHARAKTRRSELERRNSVLQQTNEEFEQTKAQLEETVAELQTANERLEQFTYAASHDLQEPLRMVSSYLQLLDTRYQEDLDEEAQEFIDFAVGGADRMRAMVKSLHQYSRVSTHGDPLKPVESKSVVDTVLDELGEQIQETNATITTDELPRVKANPDQLAMVFENIISNALTFSGDDPPEVHISAEPANQMWEFSISDEGIGIDPEYHDRIFTAFEDLRTDKEKGEMAAGGLGLALCERIVGRHGGDIWVESESGEGATFYFTLPSGGINQTGSTASPPEAP